MRGEPGRPPREVRRWAGWGGRRPTKGPVYKKNKGTDKEKTVHILDNVGFHIYFVTGSGTPYSLINQSIRTGDFTAAQRSTLKGSINGSYLPWNSSMDVRIDKNLDIKFGKKDADDSEKKKTTLQIYLQVLNALNTRNVQSVYQYTGSPATDGYLNSQVGAQYVSQQLNPQSYSDLYTVKLADPRNYSLPRRIRLGLIFSF